MLFFSSLDNLLYVAYIIFQKGVDNFELSTKHANFWLRVKYYICMHACLYSLKCNFQPRIQIWQWNFEFWAPLWTGLRFLIRKTVPFTQTGCDQPGVLLDNQFKSIMTNAHGRTNLSIMWVRNREERRELGREGKILRGFFFSNDNVLYPSTYNCKQFRLATCPPAWISLI